MVVVNCPAHGGVGLVSELRLYPRTGEPAYLANSASSLLTLESIEHTILGHREALVDKTNTRRPKNSTPNAVCPTARASPTDPIGVNRP